MKQTTLFDNNIQRLKHKPVSEISDTKVKETKLAKIAYKPTSIDSDIIPGFDVSIGDWIYPINFPIREYQLQIVQECLFKNTLVCLPTGLGKTFIASVVMFNFYRWYPSGKIIFVAPTRPLVNQQMYAFQDTVPIDPSEIIELTGSINKNLRINLWKRKRVFFLTAQTLVNDLASKICPGKNVVFLVLDEAHKASKNHSYCQVIRELTGENYGNRTFRVLGLSATPGNDIATIQDVIQNLLISHIELRTDECKDIKIYSHERAVEEIVVPLGTVVCDIRDRLFEICKPIIERLKSSNALASNISHKEMSKFRLLKLKEDYKEKCQSRISYHILADFGQLISLYHVVQLVQQHGLKPAFLFLANAIANSQSMPQVLDLMTNKHFMEFFEYFDQKMKSDSFVSGHPKLVKLLEIVKDHFNSKSVEEQKTSRVIIFTQIRDSVDEIIALLLQMEPLVRPVAFMGKTKQMNQQKQMEAMTSFTKGTANVLVSTCIGEEGLDIGEVDLIICFDSQKSPIQLVQRAGRTGRKRQGRVVMLLSEGKEVSNYRQSVHKKSRIHSVIFEGYKHLVFYPENPRMVPLGIEPTVSYVKVDIPNKKECIPTKKISKTGRQKPIDNFTVSLTQASKLNTVPDHCDGMRFLGEPGAIDGTFYHRYGRDFHKNSFYQTQPTFIVGHSSLTKTFISVLRLKESHTRGKTNMLFHLSSSRIIDIDEPLTQVAKENSQHSINSFALSMSSEEESTQSYEPIDCLTKINKYVVISSCEQTIKPPLPTEKFNDLLTHLEHNKPDIIKELDQEIENYSQRERESNTPLPLFKPNTSSKFYKRFEDPIIPQPSEKNGFEIENRNSIVTSSSTMLQKNNFLCTSTPICSSKKPAQIKNLISSFNIPSVSCSRENVSKKKLSILESFNLSSHIFSSGNLSSSLKSKANVLLNNTNTSQIGMESALRYFDQTRALQCDLSSDLFDDDDFSCLNLSSLNEISTTTKSNKSSLINSFRVIGGSSVVDNLQRQSPKPQFNVDEEKRFQFEDDDIFDLELVKILESEEEKHLDNDENKITEFDSEGILDSELMKVLESEEEEIVKSEVVKMMGSETEQDIELSDENKCNPQEEKRYQSDEDLFSDDFDMYSPLSNEGNSSPSFTENSQPPKEENAIDLISPENTKEKEIESNDSDDSDSFLITRPPASVNRSRSPSFGSSCSVVNPSELEPSSLKKPSRVTFKKKLNPVREYFLSQADISGNSEDHFDEDDDFEDIEAPFESSFIDDQEKSVFVNTQMQQVYLQSIKSPNPILKRNIRLSNTENSSPDFIYSQPMSSDDDYLMDSFIVPNDYKSPKRRKKKLLNSSNDSSPVPAKKFKRLASLND